MSARRVVLFLYCAITGGTFAFVSLRLALEPVGSEFLGLHLMAVTLPWSLIVVPVLAVASPDLTALNVIALLACGLLNVALIARAGTGERARLGDGR